MTPVIIYLDIGILVVKCFKEIAIVHYNKMIIIIDLLY
jgi:hypothetical protein